LKFETGKTDMAWQLRDVTSAAAEIT
jgi:hypothetical protein